MELALLALSQEGEKGGNARPPLSHFHTYILGNFAYLSKFYQSEPPGKMGKQAHRGIRGGDQLIHYQLASWIRAYYIHCKLPILQGNSPLYGGKHGKKSNCPCQYRFLDLVQRRTVTAKNPYNRGLSIDNLDIILGYTPI